VIELLQLVAKTEAPEEIKTVKIDNEEHVIQWSVLRGHSVSQLFNLYNNNTVLPKLENCYWRFLLSENGGGYSNTGHATIICGLNGEKLKPFRVIKRGHLACSEHATFIGQRFVEIHVNHHREDFSVSIYRWTINDNIVKRTEVWSLDQSADALYDDVMRSIPRKYDSYKEAIEAGLRKSTCYHCREPHFIR